MKTEVKMHHPYRRACALAAWAIAVAACGAKEGVLGNAGGGGDDAGVGGATGEAGSGGELQDAGGSGGTEPIDATVEDAKEETKQDAGCPAGYAECDGNIATTCETDLQADTSHCGACKHDCLGSTCALGRCAPQLLTTEAGITFNMFLYGDDLIAVNYGSSPGYGSIVRFPKAGGAVQSLATGLDLPQGASMFGATVLFHEYYGDVHSMPLAGAVALVTHDAATVGGPVVSDGSSVYYTRFTQGQIMKVASTGGTPSVFADGQSYPQGLLIDSGKLYWCNDNGTVMEMALQGATTPKTLTGNAGCSSRIIVEGDFLYTVYNESIARIPRAGGPGKSLATVGTTRSFTMDATHFYVSGEGWVRRISRSSGDELPLGYPPFPDALTLDDKYLYWSDTMTGSCKVERVAK
jgi:hypothetical protein